MPSTTSARLLLLLTSCLISILPLTSSQCSSFIPTDVTNYTGLPGYRGYTGYNTTPITISWPTTCTSNRTCYIYANNAPTDYALTDGSHTNDTNIEMFIGGIITDNRTLAFSTAAPSTSHNGTEGPFTITTSLDAAVEASLFDLIGAAANITFIPSVTTNQTGPFGFELPPGESAYVVFHPQHLVRP